MAACNTGRGGGGHPVVKPAALSTAFTDGLIPQNFIFDKWGHTKEVIPLQLQPLQVLAGLEGNYSPWLPGGFVQHADTSNQADIAPVLNRFFKGQTYDTFGHVQTNQFGQMLPLTAGQYLTGYYSPEEGGTIAHADTSNETDKIGGFNEFVKGTRLDGAGHVTESLLGQMLPLNYGPGLLGSYSPEGGGAINLNLLPVQLGVGLTGSYHPIVGGTISTNLFPLTIGRGLSGFYDPTTGGNIQTDLLPLGLGAGLGGSYTPEDGGTINLILQSLGLGAGITGSYDPIAGGSIALNLQPLTLAPDLSGSYHPLFGGTITTNINMTGSAITLPPGSPATFSIVKGGATYNLTIGVPQGLQGIQGIQGFPGLQGPPGPPGTVDIVMGPTPIVTLVGLGLGAGLQGSYHPGSGGTISVNLRTMTKGDGLGFGLKGTWSPVTGGTIEVDTDEIQDEKVRATAADLTPGFLIEKIKQPGQAGFSDLIQHPLGFLVISLASTTKSGLVPFTNSLALTDTPEKILGVNPLGGVSWFETPMNKADKDGMVVRGDTPAVVGATLTKIYATDDNDEPQWYEIPAGISGSDKLVMATSADTTAGYLTEKLKLPDASSAPNGDLQYDAGLEALFIPEASDAFAGLVPAGLNTGFYDSGNFDYVLAMDSANGLPRWFSLQAPVLNTATDNGIVLRGNAANAAGTPVRGWTTDAAGNPGWRNLPSGGGSLPPLQNLTTGVGLLGSYSPLTGGTLTLDVKPLTLGAGLTGSYNPLTGGTITVSAASLQLNTATTSGIVLRGDTAFVAGTVTKVWGTDTGNNPLWRETIILESSEFIGFVEVAPGRYKIVLTVPGTP